MSVIISFDPGETTGAAVVQWLPNDGAAIVRYAFERDAVGIKDYLIAVQTGKTAAYLRLFPDSLIVCEQFRLYPWKGKAKAWSDLPEVLVQGAIEYVAYAIGVELNYQTPAAMKQLFPETGCAVREEAAGYGVPRHGRDALCHALFAIVRREGLGEIPRLVWGHFRRAR